MKGYDYIVYVEEFPQFCESYRTKESAYEIAELNLSIGLRGTVSMLTEEDVIDLATYDPDHGVVEFVA